MSCVVEIGYIAINIFLNERPSLFFGKDAFQLSSPFLWGLPWLGVCFPNLRPDVKEYLGGSGFLYDSIREVPKIISQSYPDKMREIGFEQAKKSDIAIHKKLLVNLWDNAIGNHYL